MDVLSALQEQEHRSAFYEAVRIGDEQILRGEGREFTPDLIQQLAEQARRNVEQGILTDNPDVRP